VCRFPVMVIPLLLTMLLFPAKPQAAGRMGRQISDIPGMPVGVSDVGQDTTGYLWISSSEGLSRYDGFEVRPWGVVKGRLTYVETGPGGRVLGGDPRTGLYEVEGPALREIEGPEGADAAGPSHAVYDREARLWAAWDGRLLRREDGGWIEIGGREMAEDRALQLARRDDGGVLVGSLQGDVWIVDGDDRARRIAEGLGGWVMQLHDDPLGPVATVRFGPRPGLVRVTEDGVEHLLDWSARSEGLARRGSTYWIAYCTGVWAVHDDGTKEFLSAREGFTGFGNIAVDREGGLWMASVRGLSHYPQPDTRIWTELSGLPRVYLRGAHPVAGGVILTSWRGPMFLDEEGGAHDLDVGGLFSRDVGCADPWGGVWMKAFPPPDDPERVDSYRPVESMLVEWRDGRARVRRRGGWYRGDLACDEGPGGTLWLMANGELLEITGPGEEPRLRARLPSGTTDSRIQSALLVRDDRSEVLAGFYRGEICAARYPAGDEPLEDRAWTCDSFTQGTALMDMMETPRKDVWLAMAGGGVFERYPGGWRRVPGELSDLREAIALRPSPSGGVWVVGWRQRWRVERRNPEEPPTVVERLDTGQGVPDWQNAPGLHEEPDGTIWIPLYSGLVRVPPKVRRQAAEPVSVTVTSLIADGRQVLPDRAPTVRHGNHSLEVRWSALSFRDPTRVHYRMRLESEPDWSILHQPFVRIAGLDSGRHRIELAASLDGLTWSEEPAVVEFRVRKAWYLQGWFVALALAGAVALVYLAYRLRLAHLLGLERQRTRIAMDLHDEMGAGLGSAGLLVGLLGDGDLEPQERRRIGERAAAQIRDLGGSLADIVWSLRPGTDSLDALLLFLRQRAGDLFVPGGGARVNFDAPDPCPALPLGLAQQRNLHWIAVEAMSNAARHSGATRVEVTLRPDAGPVWRLAVRDDGRGFSAEDAADNGPGMGRESMRRRAREIGADLRIRSAPGEGTEVVVRFRPGGTL